MATKILDVTKIEPRFKHPTIFQTFNDLEEGDAFVIHNDHDPKPLYYQFKAEKGDIFDWEYLEEGPEWWKVKISKKILDKPETVGEMAGKDLRVAELFRSYDLEFCCDGKKSLEQSCADAGVSVEEIKEKLKNLPDAQVDHSQDYDNWELDFLADYIKNVHHRYVRNNTRMLTDLSAKISSVHGSSHKELYEIEEHVNALLAEMQIHQMKEEKTLFPFIRGMVDAKERGEGYTNSAVNNLEDPVEMLEHEHQSVGEHIHAIERLSSGYQVPADGCDSYRLYFHKLEEFDKDVHQHLHLENNILFPKALAMYAEINN